MRETWDYKKFTDIVWFQEGPGVRNTQYTKSGIKLLNVSNLVDGNLELSNSSRYISEEEAYGRYKHFLVDEGDLIIASSGIQVSYFEKKMALVKQDHLPLCMNTSTIRFKVLDRNVLDILYFMFFLKSEVFKSVLSKQITGSAQLNFGPSHLKRMSICLPPLSIQHSIIAELEEINNLLSLKRKELETYDKLAQSLFYEMFGDPVENEKGWEASTLESVCSSIVRGPFGSTLKKEFFVEPNDTTYKVYEQKHAIQKDWQIGSYYVTEDKFKELSRFELNAGDIIMSCSGTIGELYRIPACAEKGLMNQALLKFTLNKRIEYLYFLFLMDFVKRDFTVRGTGLKNIGSVKIIKGMTFGIPPLPLQQLFASRIEAIEEQKKQVKAAIEKLETLLASRMQYWFD